MKQPPYSLCSYLMNPLPFGTPKGEQPPLGAARREV